MTFILEKLFRVSKFPIHRLNQKGNPMDDQWKAQYELTYLCQMSRLYHQKRERFFALLDRFSKAFSLLSGTAAFSSLLATPESKALAGLAVALFTLPSLVFAWSDKARLHGELAAMYAHIESEIAAEGTLEWHRIDAFKARVLALDAKEPPSLSALVRLCQNELALAAGQPDKVSPLTQTERIFVHLFDMPRQSPSV